MKATRDQRKAEKSSGVAKSELTPYFPTSHYALRKYWNAQKDIVAPWWKENSKEAYSDGTKRLSLGVSNHRDSLTGKRKGQPVGFPKYHKRSQHESVRFTTGNIGVTLDRHHILLPVIGQIRTHESTRKLARHLERGKGRIIAATLSHKQNRWFVSFTVEVDRDIPAPRKGNRIIGIDVGINTLHIGASPTGEELLRTENPRNTDKQAKLLRRSNKNLARKQNHNKQTGTKPSNRYIKEQERLRRIHAKPANCRRDLTNKTTTNIAKNFDRIVVEDLHVAGIVQSGHLGKQMSDGGLGEFYRQLKYKTLWYGSTLVIADRFYPSSKTCSKCGIVKAKLPRFDRIYKCTVCPNVLNRDLNAAVNLAKLGLPSQPSNTVVNTGSSPESGREGLHKTKIPKNSMNSKDINVVADEASILKQPAMVA
jgi:putative transposase